MIDLAVLQSGRTRRRTTAVQAILRKAQSTSQPITIDTEVAEDLEAYEKRTGGGPRAVLKALKVGSQPTGS